MMPPESALARIHQAARSEFREKGFQGASLRNIVKSVGMTTGAFYGYYKSKEALFEALVGAHYRYLVGRFCQAQKEFARLPRDRQPEVLGDFSGACMFDMLHYAYDHLEECQLLLCAADRDRCNSRLHGGAGRAGAPSSRDRPAAGAYPDHRDVPYLF